MASNPVQNVVTIQNVSDSIINVVQTGHLTGKYEDIARQLADILKSAEVEHLSTEEKEEVAALAEIVKDEFGKAPSPDQGKPRRSCHSARQSLRPLWRKHGLSDNCQPGRRLFDVWPDCLNVKLGLIRACANCRTGLPPKEWPMCARCYARTYTAVATEAV